MSDLYVVELTTGPAQRANETVPRVLETPKASPYG